MQYCTSLDIDVVCWLLVLFNRGRGGRVCSRFSVAAPAAAQRNLIIEARQEAEEARSEPLDTREGDIGGDDPHGRLHQATHGGTLASLSISQFCLDFMFGHINTDSM